MPIGGLAEYLADPESFSGEESTKYGMGWL
jgi:hypothetical protein